MTTHDPASSTSPTPDPDHPHLVSPHLLITVFAGLFILTILTVLVSRIDLGPFNIVFALLIAAAKASLVLLFFMHLRWDSPFYSIILVSALIFVVAFIGMATLDTLQYQPTFPPPSGISAPP